MATKARDPLADKAFANRVRRSLVGVQLDISNMGVLYRDGVVHLSGNVKALGGDVSGADLRRVIDVMVEEVKAKNPAVREVVTAYLRIVW